LAKWRTLQGQAALFALATDVIIGRDARGTITWWNSAAEAVGPVRPSR